MLKYRNPRRARLGRIVDVPEIDQRIASRDALHPVEVERSEWIPFGEDHDRVGALHRIIRPVQEGRAGQ